MDSHVTYIQTQGHKSLGPPIRVIANKAYGTQGLKETKMKERRRRKLDGRWIRQWQFKKTKMKTSGQLSKAYIQLCTDFKVQLETYINKP
jgi:hypothetical protein